MSRVRVIFLGTPDFAVTCLKGLHEDEHFELVGVVTQPDRPAGRKMQMQPSSVKSYCLAHGIRVISPESVNTDSMLQQIEIWNAEVAVVVAFGQLLSEKFLKLFPLGAVNIHGSLLPRWRGAAPIQRAVEAGDLETGVALQKVVKKLDAGAILGIRKIPLTDMMDSEEVYLQLAQLGVDLLHVELMDYVRGNLVGEEQDESLVTYAKKIEKAEGEIQWDQSARRIDQKIRAFVTGPGTWTYYCKKKIKIHRAMVVESPLVVENSPQAKILPGTIVKAEGDDLWVQTGAGLLSLQVLQPESRNRLFSAEFLKGYSLKQGELFERGDACHG